MGTSILRCLHVFSCFFFFFFFASYSSCTTTREGHSLMMVASKANEGEAGEEAAEGEDKVVIGPFQDPVEEVKFEGGLVRVWWRDESCVGGSQTRCIEVSETILEEDGLMLPQYSDSSAISYVLEGSGKVGIVNPRSDHILIRRVERGDVVVIPQGVVFWWYNDGFGAHKIFSVSDTTEGVPPGLYHQFALVGAKVDRFGGILHGFSNETLAFSWGVDEDTVSLLLSSQNGSAIIKSPKRIIFADLRISRIGRNDGEENGFRAEDRDIFSEFRYNLDKEYPELYVEGGGWVKAVNEDDLHALEQVQMSVMMISLDKNATEGPIFFSDAHQIAYVTDGRGKVEVSTPGDKSNESFVSFEVQQGSVFVIPKLYPSIKLASDEGFSSISILTSSRPSAQYLVGRDSFFEGIPKEVLLESFSITEEVLSKILGARMQHGFIFPPLSTPSSKE